MGKQPRMTFQQKVAQLKKDHRLSYSKFADEIGVDRGKPDRWINEGVAPSLADAFKIAKRFGVSLKWLADDTMVDPPASPAPPSVWRASLEEQIKELGADGERIASKALTVYTERLTGEPDRSTSPLIHHQFRGRDGHDAQGGRE